MGGGSRAWTQGWVQAVLFSDEQEGALRVQGRPGPEGVLASAGVGGGGRAAGGVGGGKGGGPGQGCGGDGGAGTGRRDGWPVHGTQVAHCGRDPPGGEVPPVRAVHRAVP